MQLQITSSYQFAFVQAIVRIHYVQVFSFTVCMITSDVIQLLTLSFGHENAKQNYHAHKNGKGQNEHDDCKYLVISHLALAEVDNSESSQLKCFTGSWIKKRVSV